MKAFAATYEDVKEDVERVAKKHALRGADREELQAEANLYFVQAYYKYKQECGDFDRWVKYYVRMNLLERSRTIAKQREAMKTYLETRPQQDPHPVELLLRELGEDAREAVGLLLSGPKGEGAKTALHRVKTLLLGKGLRAKVVEGLFHEIREAL